MLTPTIQSSYYRLKKTDKTEVFITSSAKSLKPKPKQARPLPTPKNVQMYPQHGYPVQQQHGYGQQVYQQQYQQPVYQPPQGHYQQPPQPMPQQIPQQQYYQQPNMSGSMEIPMDSEPGPVLKLYKDTEIQRIYPHIAKGSYGVVYKGNVFDRKEIVVIKDMETKNESARADWQKEIEMMK